MRRAKGLEYLENEIDPSGITLFLVLRGFVFLFRLNSFETDVLDLIYVGKQATTTSRVKPVLR